MRKMAMILKKCKKYIWEGYEGGKAKRKWYTYVILNIEDINFN